MQREAAVSSRKEEDGVYQAAQGLYGLETALLMLEQRLFPVLQRRHLGFEFGPGESVLDGVMTLRIPARTRSNSRSADDRLARCSIRRRFISRVNSSQNSSNKS